MRKPRDYDAELKALDDRAKDLRTRKVRQLGELLLATGADALPIEELAGALLGVVGNKDAAIREGWRERGAAFFQGGGGSGGRSRGDRGRAAANAGGAQSSAAKPGAE